MGTFRVEQLVQNKIVVNARFEMKFPVSLSPVSLWLYSNPLVESLLLLFYGCCLIPILKIKQLEIKKIGEPYISALEGVAEESMEVRGTQTR